MSALAKGIIGGNTSESTTPQETKGLTTNLAGLFQQLFGGSGGMAGGVQAGSQAIQQGGQAAAANLFGVNPSQLGLGDAAKSMLTNPADATSGLFAAMAPQEQRITDQQVGGLRDLFGTMGGRFSRNVATGETNLRTQLGQGFDLNRSNALLQAQQNQTAGFNGVSSALLNAMGQGNAASQGFLNTATQFGAAGPTQNIYQPGILPGLANTAATLAGGKAAGLFGSSNGGGFQGGGVNPLIFAEGG